MGFLVIPADNPSEVLPDVSSNAAGRTAWSGKHVADLSGADVIAIFMYCRSEAYRQGWNDAIYKRNSSDQGPFPSELLGGLPAEQWNYHYQQGVAECRDARGE